MKLLSSFTYMNADKCKKWRNHTLLQMKKKSKVEFRNKCQYIRMWDLYNDISV